MHKTRRYVVFFTLIIVLLSLLIRLFYLQVISFSRFSKMAANQHNRAVKIEPRRGSIFDKYIDPLAINLDTSSVYCDPRHLNNKERTSRILSKTLNIDPDSLLERFERGKAFAWVKRKVSAKEADAVRKLALPGIYLTTESKRNYSNDSMAAHVIGFAGIDNNGLEGLELLFDEKLKGRPGWRHLIKDAKKQTVLFNEKESIPARDGHNIVLTIDSVVQYIVEEELDSMARKFNPSSASIVVMEPSSGKILALANWPSYNLNEPSKVQKKFMKNAAVASIYEPGSVFKIVTASAALNENIFDLERSVYCENGEYRTNRRVLHDFHRYGELTFRDIIVKSSNIGTVKVAQELGEETVYKYIKKFGFGKKTGIDLPGEVSGISRPPNIWSRSDITTIPIGQGIAVTPIQLACAISVIANGGYLMKPYVVDTITTWKGETYKEFKPVIKDKVLSPETCEKMKEILGRVVTEGTGKRARSKLYELCGKTGTAQRVNPAGGYYPDKYNATFIGFAPAREPLVSIVVVTKDPHPVYFGGSVAGPTFKRIAERTLQYLESNAAEREE